MNGRTALLWLIGLLALAALACAQAGEILTPEEATARAAAPQSGGGSGDIESIETDAFQPGDQATLVGRGFLINLYDAPGGRISAGQERGATVEIITAAADAEGDVWYQISAPTGEGWVPATDLEPIEGGGAASEGETAEGGASEGGAGEADALGVALGDTVYLTARGFLVDIMNEPGGNRLIANQERGAAVMVLDRAEVDGAVWYLIDAPTGEGWVSSENVTLEAP